MTSSEMNPLYQQMGELLGSMKALHDKVDFRHAQAEKQGEAVQAECPSGNILSSLSWL